MGWDAHAAAHLSCHKEETFAREMVDRLGLNLLDTVPLQKI